MLALELGLVGGVDVTVGVLAGLEVVLELALGLVLELPEALGLGLVVLWLDDVAGAVVVRVPLVGELVLACVADEDVEDGEQDVVGAGTTTGLLDPPPPGEGTGVPPWPSGTPVALLLVEGLLLVKA